MYYIPVYGNDQWCLVTLVSLKPMSKAMRNKISQYKLLSVHMTSFMNMNDCCGLKQAELWSHWGLAIRGLPTAVPECKVSQSSLVPFAWIKYLRMNPMLCDDRRVHYSSQRLTWNRPHPGSKLHILFHSKNKTLIIWKQLFFFCGTGKWKLTAYKKRRSEACYLQNMLSSKFWF